MTISEFIAFSRNNFLALVEWLEDAVTCLKEIDITVMADDCRHEARECLSRIESRLKL